MKSPHVPIRESRVHIAKGRTLGCAEFGEPDGHAVFWFHGTPGGRLQVPPDAPREAKKRGIRLIGVERPGTGWSSPHRYARVRDFAEDVGRLADALALPRFGVVGLSGGGPYALACAHDLSPRIVGAGVLGGIGPVLGKDAVPSYTRALALIGPAMTLIAEPIGRALPGLVRPLVPHASRAVRAFAAIAPEADRPVLTNPAFEAVLVGDLVRVMEGGLGAGPHDARLFARDWGFRLRDIRTPVYFWQGEADGIVPPSHGRHQAKLVRGSTLTMCPGEGHFAGYTNAAQVFDALLGEFDRAQPDPRTAKVSATSGT